MNINIDKKSPVVWGFIILIVLIQASWIFNDASKRGENKWIWGLLGCINVPSSLLIYLIVTRNIIKSKPCNSCGGYGKKSAKYCSHCGEKLE